MAKRTNVTTTNTTTNTSIMAAAQRVATRRTTADHKVVTAKAMRPLLQEVKLVRTGGNSANGLRSNRALPLPTCCPALRPARASKTQLARQATICKTALRIAPRRALPCAGLGLRCAARAL